MFLVHCLMLPVHLVQWRHLSEGAAFDACREYHAPYIMHKILTAPVLFFFFYSILPQLFFSVV